MKKTKLLVLFLSSAFLLAGCNKDTCQCPQITTQTGGDTANDEQAVLRGVIKTQLTSIFNDAIESVDNQVLKSYIDDLKSLALREADDVENIIDEDDAINIALEIALKYSNENFKDKVISVLTERLLNLVSLIKDFERQGFLREIYDTGVRNLQDSSETFDDIIEQFNNVNYQIDEYIGSTQEQDFIIKYKEEVREYAMSLYAEHSEYLDKDIIMDKVDEELLNFSTVKTDADAQQLVSTLKGTLYQFVFNLFKQGLCGALDGFVNSLREYITDQTIIEDSCNSLADDKDSIMREDTFERAFTNYEYCIEYYSDELTSRLSRWGLTELDGIKETYKNSFQEGSKEWGEFYIEYYKVYSEIENISSHVFDVESDIKQLLEDFESYCLENAPQD